MKAGFSHRRTVSSLKSIAVFCLLAGLFSLTVSAQDLASLARKEKARRAKLASPGKVLTESDVTAQSGAVSQASSETPAAGVPQPEPSPSPVDPAAQKALWKGKAQAARDEVTKAEDALAQLELELATFRSDLTQVPADEAQDPLRLQKREARIAEMQKAVVGQKSAVASAKAALAAFEDEARRAGVPPGWLR